MRKLLVEGLTGTAERREVGRGAAEKALLDADGAGDEVRDGTEPAGECVRMRAAPAREWEEEREPGAASRRTALQTRVS